MGCVVPHPHIHPPVFATSIVPNHHNLCQGALSGPSMSKWAPQQRVTGGASRRPGDSPYAGGVFMVKIHFPPDYPFKPPKVLLPDSCGHACA